MHKTISRGADRDGTLAPYQIGSLKKPLTWDMSLFLMLNSDVFVWTCPNKIIRGWQMATNSQERPDYINSSRWRLLFLNCCRIKHYIKCATWHQYKTRKSKISLAAKGKISAVLSAPQSITERCPGILLSNHFVLVNQCKILWGGIFSLSAYIVKHKTFAVNQCFWMTWQAIAPIWSYCVLLQHVGFWKPVNGDKQANISISNATNTNQFYSYE